MGRFRTLTGFSRLYRAPVMLLLVSSCTNLTCACACVRACVRACVCVCVCVCVQVAENASGIPYRSTTAYMCTHIYGVVCASSSCNTRSGGPVNQKKNSPRHLLRRQQISHTQDTTMSCVWTRIARSRPRPPNFNVVSQWFRACLQR